MKVSNMESKINHVKYTYIENNSNTLCIMLSGSGYSYEKPLLYYSTMHLIENDIDIIQIRYSYDSTHFEMNIEDFIKIIIEDVDSVIAEVFFAKQYEKIIFLGKSLGTLPICFKYINNNSYQKSKFILLTPLLQIDGFHEIIKQSTDDLLIIIGTKERYYNNEKIEGLRNIANLELYEIAGANHSLEIEPINTASSLKIMEKVIEAFNLFISE